MPCIVSLVSIALFAKASKVSRFAAVLVCYPIMHSGGGPPPINNGNSSYYGAYVLSCEPSTNCLNSHIVLRNVLGPVHRLCVLDFWVNLFFVELILLYSLNETLDFVLYWVEQKS